MHTSRAFSRRRLLDAARGLDFEDKRPLRCFPLKQHHFKRFPSSPADFHSVLCDAIENAQDRIYLASLYVGPAADTKKYTREVRLLDALSNIRPGVETKILMDEHRGLRPVPLAHSSDSTTSAAACQEAQSNAEVYLLSVLPPLMQQFLPNPYNEVAGVFHIKAYIVDNQLILSGANLSEEYFSDRHDRYLWIENNDLVECYADLVKVLCDHAVRYGEEESDDAAATEPPRDLLEDVCNVLCADETEAAETFDDVERETDVVAYCVPTFQAPSETFPAMASIPSDVDVIQALVRASAETDENSTLRVASAYLNPTESFQSVWRRAHLLTAGRVSHGFKPKKKAGNKGKDWIPTVFDHLARQAENASVWFYQRADWTFHAKGLWLSSSEEDVRFQDGDDLYAVTHGSGNFGGRSETRDMESNLIFIFPPNSPLAEAHKDEWNTMCEHAAPEHEEERKELSWALRLLLQSPLGRSFF